MYVLCSYRRSLGNLPEYFQPTATEGMVPGITKKRGEAKQFSSRAEAELAIPGFELLKREQFRILRARCKAIFGEYLHHREPIVIEPVLVAMA